MMWGVISSVATNAEHQRSFAVPQSFVTDSLTNYYSLDFFKINKEKSHIPGEKYAVWCCETSCYSEPIPEF